ncbi:HD domain-containing phosphohydrolase [Alkalimarinus sediminis]|uniref:HD domain-containing protein n=1 Tax=Alkalimarinus sediminis TaxID=1632866 RepID=A0A9E8HJH2_9ALTE|nr:HD domain-containing phosphohydrolase [Alkalimarinus sediminis]UZW75810.1 HD domain-containing protein [Alkalimarinus sediminis]
MTLQISTEATEDVINDFANEFYDAYELCEIKLVELENNPTNQELINLIFRAIHTVKGNLSFVGLQPLLPLLQSVEDLLAKIREGSLSFSASLSDVILLSIDHVKSVIDELTGQDKTELTALAVQQIRDSITGIVTADPATLQQAINATINTLAPETVITEDEAPPTYKPEKKRPSGEQNLLKVLQRYGVEPSDDINLMIALVSPFERRSPYWYGKAERQLLLTLGMNKLSGNRTDPAQLAAATLMHDFGMCFLPTETLHKNTPYSTEEKEQIHQHPITAYELLSKMHKWQDAAEIVLQHHEHMNGNGYPNKLVEEEITDGAKIIAIVDTFDAIMHERAHIEMVKRPFIRAVLEINRYSDTQFSSEWVEIFNQFAQKLRSYNTTNA